MNESHAYAYVIELATDGSYWGYLPDLPGCTTSASTSEAVEAQLPEAVELYLSYYRDRGQPLPKPATKVGVLNAA